MKEDEKKINKKVRFMKKNRFDSLTHGVRLQGTQYKYITNRIPAQKLRK